MTYILCYNGKKVLHSKNMRIIFRKISINALFTQFFLNNSNCLFFIITKILALSYKVENYFRIPSVCLSFRLAVCLYLTSRKYTHCHLFKMRYSAIPWHVRYWKLKFAPFIVCIQSGSKNSLYYRLWENVLVYFNVIILFQRYWHRYTSPLQDMYYRIWCI